MSTWGAIRRLEVSDDTSAFECGLHPLDDYFKRHARRNMQLGTANCFVMPKPNDSEYPPICGYYTLSMFSLESVDVAALINTKLPAYPSPACMLGRFAIHRLVHRKGGGEHMLVDAIARGLGGDIGTMGMVTDAKDERAVKFYSKYGFSPLFDVPAFPRRMFLPRSAAPFKAS